MLHLFPAEIALQTISYLPLHALYSFMLVSRKWNALVTLNEPSVYKSAALLHRFVNGDQLSSGSDASTISDWKAYCRRELEIERGWHGEGPSVAQGLFRAPGPIMNRIKVDYELGFVVSAPQNGGLSVCEMKSNRVLWALPSSHIRSDVHVTYDRGYIVFKRNHSHKEVWRYNLDAKDGYHPENFPPDKKMLDAATEAAARFDSEGGHHGHFTAWALLHLPKEPHWFDFSYPNLLTITVNDVYIWDITRMQLASIIRDYRRGYRDLTMPLPTRIKVNDLYVFACDDTVLRIFARNDGALLYQLPSKEIYGVVWDLQPQICHGIAHPEMSLRNKHCSSSDGAFKMCLVSPSGKDLVISTRNGKMILLPHFQRLFAGSEAIHHRDITIILDFQPFSSDLDDSPCLNLVVGQNGKVAIATENDFYVISLDFDFSRLTADRPPEPGVTIWKLSGFEYFWSLSLLPSCMQIAHDAIYVMYRRTWEMDRKPGINTMYAVRF